MKMTSPGSKAASIWILSVCKLLQELQSELFDWLWLRLFWLFDLILFDWILLYISGITLL